MLRFLYCRLLRLHPPRFRERFAEEMLSIFDHVGEGSAAAKLVVDGFMSLVRQWALRSEYWEEKQIASVAPSADGVPIFCILDERFRPRTSALIHGGLLTLVMFCATCLALRYNWTHPARMPFTGVEFGTSPDVEVPASSRVLPRAGVELMPSEGQTISPRPKTGDLKEVPSSLGRPLFSQLQTPAPLSRIQTQSRFDASGATPPDSSPHVVRFIPVASNVKLEVLDWGGSGRALVLLAGLGNTAHVFDHFAPKLAASFHVYGITRRGFGASSVPADRDGNYSADRLGDDVLAVVDSLGLNRPVLVGHSIAGEELSSIGTRHPAKVAGLVYLDAGYSYAFYDRSRGDLILDSLELRRKLEQLIPGKKLQERKQVVQELLATVPRFERTLREHQKDMQFVPEPLQPSDQVPVAAQAIVAGEQKYTDIRCPILAIFAVPHNLGPAFQDDPVARAAAEATDAAWTGGQARAFETGLPSARVVRLANASHFVFQSNESDVLREMNGFLGSLP